MIFYKAFTAVMVFLYRLFKGQGRIGKPFGSPTLLLTTTGRKSGKQHTTPLGYLKDGNSYILVASNAGADKHPAWYLNLKANPKATIEVQDKREQVRAEEVKPEDYDRVWQKFVAVYPSYAQYTQKTTRKIPLMLLSNVA